MRNKIFLGLIALGAVAGSIFYACQKDKDEKITKRYILPTDLKEYEFYTPDETAMGNELVSFAGYMNNVGSVMPDMEIKDAIWYAEAFFNLAICAKQENGAKAYDLKKTYEITIPFVENAGNILLDGEVLQSAYRNLLLSIKANICSDYVINYGDVYAMSINAASNTIVLGLDIFYGCPFDPNCNCNCTGGICRCANAIAIKPYCSKIVTENYSPVEYPYYPNRFTSDPLFTVMNIIDKPTQNVTMYQTLNRMVYDPDRIFPASIISKDVFGTPMFELSKTIQPLFSNLDGGARVETAVHSHGGYVVDINVYAPQYRDAIWNWWNINQSYSNTAFPAGFEPYIADCYIVAVNDPNNQGKYIVQHIYGLQSICRFCCGPPHADVDFCEEVGGK